MPQNDISNTNGKSNTNGNSSLTSVQNNTSSNTTTTTIAPVPPNRTWNPRPPVPTGKVIVIDAGHGGPDSGAIGIGGVMEKNLTLDYALAVKQALVSRGYQVYLTRTSDQACSPKTSDVESEIRCRTALSKQYHASVYVSIHMNWFSNSSANGTETLYNNTNHREGMENPYPAQSMRLAEKLEQYLTAAIHTKNRGSQNDELYNLITNTVPASLVEVGFISNQKDLDKILDPNVKASFANAFADAIDAYLAKLK
jgi:N-acetylmuramoyl-L-alanine amidase